MMGDESVHDEDVLSGLLLISKCQGDQREKTLLWKNAKLLHSASPPLPWHLFRRRHPR